MHIPQLQSHHPRLGNAFTQWLGRTLLYIIGWRLEGHFPKDKKFVACVAPHTSNWDFFIAIFAVLAMGLKASWIGKHQIFVWPIKGLLCGLGGSPVNRDNPKGVIEQVVDLFHERDSMVFGIAPEGTRRYVEKWKTGFLRIAMQAQVPVYMVYLDFDRKVFGFGPKVEVNNIEQDMQQILDFYKTIPAKYPESTNS